MNIFDSFKYLSLISTPIFMTVALLLIKKTSGFTFKKHTISKTIYFIKDKKHFLIFRLNFILKSTLDLLFVYFLIFHLKILPTSPLFWLLIIPPILFGLLSYFVMGSHTLIHRILIFSYGILFGLSTILLANLTGNKIFLYVTIFGAITSNFLIFEFFLKRKINVFVQTISMALMYIWLLVYIFNFLF